MQTETVEYREGDWDIEVVVSEATVLMGTRRMLLMSEAFEQDGDDLTRRPGMLDTYRDAAAQI